MLKKNQLFIYLLIISYTSANSLIYNNKLKEKNNIINIIKKINEFNNFLSNKYKEWKFYFKENKSIYNLLKNIENEKKINLDNYAELFYNDYINELIKNLDIYNKNKFIYDYFKNNNNFNIAIEKDAYNIFVKKLNFEQEEMLKKNLKFKFTTNMISNLKNYIILIYNKTFFEKNFRLKNYFKSYNLEINEYFYINNDFNDLINKVYKYKDYLESKKKIAKKF